MLLTGIAGPITNVLLAVASALLFRLLSLFDLPGIVYYIVGFFTLINLVLAFFNLIPIPPLDGSRVVQWFLKGDALRVYNSFERYGILIVLVVAFVLPSVIGVNILGTYLNYTVYPISRFLLGS
jgi:Zn-dependent protease